MLKLLFEIELPIEKPNYYTHSHPDDFIRSLADSVAQGMERWRVAYHRPRPFASPADPASYGYLVPIARFIGVGVD